MNEAKAFAAFTSGLLARKGDARPAMRAQSGERRPESEDLGWNDMGVANRPRLARGSNFGPATPPPVVRQQIELAREFDTSEQPAEGDHQALKLRSRAKGLDDGKKAAFTLRLDAERHLKLRLACAVSRRSAQTIVMQALDAFLADVPANGPRAAAKRG